ncbi:MAG: energy-coupling factor transporter transmembrane protein EcfT [Bacilli bacterium]|nr:energy-coupling factor transporter transmembrane protein EcfT [Bacilli bacterium]
MNNITFGRYTTYNTFVHRLDPRNKIMMMILLVVAIFFKVDSWSSTLIMSVALLIFLNIIMLISKVSFISLFKSLKAMWILIIFLLIVYIFLPNAAYNPDHIAFYIGTYGVNYDAFYQCGYIILRIMMMLMITMILTSSTSPMNLTYGLEWYMAPLKLVKFPTHIVAMTLSIALRFIPTLLDETDRIIKAQSSRGVDFQRGGLIKKFSAIISLIIPLFVSAINRSEELSNAMEARGYDPYGQRSKYRVLKFRWIDLIAFIIVLAVFGGILTLFIWDMNIGSVDLIYWIFGAKPLF